MMGIWVLAGAVTVYAVVAAAVDCRTHRIPNYLTVPTAVLGLAYHAIAPTGWGLWTALGGAAIGFGLLFVPWLLGGAGMGDVKLLAALGAWLGPQWLLAAFAVSMIIASMIALGRMSLGVMQTGIGRVQRKYFRALRQPDRAAADHRGRQRILPFAVPVAIGTCLVLVWLVMRGGM